MPAEPTTTRSNDLISEDIVAAYEVEPQIDETEIDVDVTDGVVVLNGTVDTYAIKELAGHIAAHIAGVTEVQNQLRIRKDAGVLSDIRTKRERTAK